MSKFIKNFNSLTVILKKNADMVAYILNPTLERMEFMDFSYLIGVSEFVLMVPYPEEASRTSQLTAPLQPFNTDVEISIFFSHFNNYFFNYNIKY